MESPGSSIGPPWQPLAPASPATELHVERPHSARIYDYWLGGKDNFQADREAGEQAISGGVDLRAAARQNRAFLHRAVRFLTGETGLRQFLDIGTGIPTSPNLHETAQNIAAETRVVYVDNDPIVLAHARALLTGTPEGRTAYLDADVRDPARILTAPALHEVLDLDRPLALSLVALMHFVPDDEEAYRVVGKLVDALPAGSYLAFSHATGDFNPAAATSAERYRATGVPFRLRGHAEIARFFTGLNLIEPGITAVRRWRPDHPEATGDADTTSTFYGGVAYKA